MIFDIPIGPFESFYIGNHGDSSALTQINALNSGDHLPSDSMSTIYIPGLGIEKQNGLREVEITINFVSEDILFYNLTHGLSISNTDPSAAMADNQFYDLLCDPGNDTDQGIYVMKVRALKKYTKTRSKSRPGGTPVSFIAQDPNRYALKAYYETIADMISKGYLGTRSPY